MSRTASLLGSTPLSAVLAAALLACTGPDRSFPEAPAAGGSGPGSTGTSDTASGGAAPNTTGGEGAGGPGPGPGGTGGMGGTGGSSSTGGGAGGGAPTCDDATHACVNEVPSGWAGPLAVYQGPPDASAPACAGSYPSTIAQFNGDLDEGVADCECACDPADGIECGGSTRICYRSNQPGCIQACLQPDVTIAANTCMNVSGVGDYVQASSPAPVSMGSCEAQANHVIPQPTWGIEAKACGGGETTTLGCSAGAVCAPRATEPFGALCISRGGDVECPDAFWATKHVFHEGFEDTRACSACSCGSAESSCGGQVTFSYGGSTCANDTFGAGSVNAGSCDFFDGGDFAEHAFYSQNPSGTCPPQGGALSGSVTTEGTITFCCSN